MKLLGVGLAAGLTAGLMAGRASEGPPRGSLGAAGPSEAPLGLPKLPFLQAPGPGSLEPGGEPEGLEGGLSPVGFWGVHAQPAGGFS